MSTNDGMLAIWTLPPLERPWLQQCPAGILLQRELTPCVTALQVPFSDGGSIGSGEQSRRECEFETHDCCGGLEAVRFDGRVVIS
jgi:hypothetical protein